MMPFKQYPHFFLSVSLDGTARIWSLETFCQNIGACDLINIQYHANPSAETTTACDARIS